MPFIIPYDDYDRQENLHLGTLKVTADLIPNMKVRIAPGQFWYKGNHINWQGQTTNPIPKPLSDSHWVVISLRMASDIDANVAMTVGTPALNPDLPQLPQTDVPLAAIKVSILTTRIFNDDILDLRPYWAPIVATDELGGTTGPLGSNRVVETRILTQAEAHWSGQIPAGTGGVDLLHRAEEDSVVVLVSGGTPQQENVDWVLTSALVGGVTNKRVSWETAQMKFIPMEADDVLIITYNKYST